ncbi:MAG: phosphomevalonate kinase [Bdellovibrionota bacterium]
MKIKVSAPGKLFISGEWAILNVGNSGLVAAVDSRVYAEISESQDEFFHFYLEDFKIEAAALYDGKNLNFKILNESDQQKLSFAKAAVEAALRYFETNKPLIIRTWGKNFSLEIKDTIKKVGFGSSAAAVTAMIGGIFALFDKNPETLESKNLIFKLSSAAHFLAQGKVGSAFDVAASTYGGVLSYSRFDPDFLLKQMGSNSLRNLVESDWKSLRIKNLEIPENFMLLVAYSGKSAATGDLLKAFNKWKDKNEIEANSILNKIAMIADQAIEAFSRNNRADFFNAINENQQLLAELSLSSGVQIETPELKQISEIATNYAAGKLSGAGGGDCAIAVCFDQETKTKILRDWQAAGFISLDVSLDKQGVKIEN